MVAAQVMVEAEAETEKLVEPVEPAEPPLLTN
jgi:hypothetical protein